MSRVDLRLGERGKVLQTRRYFEAVWTDILFGHLECSECQNACRSVLAGPVVFFDFPIEDIPVLACAVRG